MTHNILAVIPARGGSKRLPRKNILNCGGKPLIAHTIQAAANSSTLTDIVFSTDDEEIKAVAETYGAYAPFLRPKSLATDLITNKDVVKHALFWMENHKNIEYDYIILLQPTSPLRKSEHINNAVNILLQSEWPTLASVSGPIKKRHQVIKKPLANSSATAFPNLAHEEFYLFDASIYGVTRHHLVTHDTIFSDPHAVFVCNDILVDVDNEQDLVIADALLRNLNKPKI